MRPITRSASARSAGESAGRSKPAAVALSRIISARPPEPVTTEIPLPRGHRSPWQTASTSLISSRSVTSIARCAFNTSENTRDSPAKPPVWLVIARCVRSTRPTLSTTTGLPAAAARGNVALGLAHGFGERRDHLGGGVVDEIFEIVDRSGDGFVAGRDREAHAIAPQIRQQRDADRAALGHDPDIAGKAARIHHSLLIGGRARRRIEDAHAVRPAHGHARLAA